MGTEATLAYVSVARDWRGYASDIVAFDLAGRVIAAWLGREALLGAHHVLAPRFDDPLRVFDSPVSWLRGERDGIVIIDWTRAAAALAGRNPRSRQRRLRQATSPAPHASGSSDRPAPQGPGGGMNEFVPLEEAERTAAELARAKPSGSERPPRFQIARFAAIKPDGNAQYLVKGLMQSTGLAVVWGAPKCGKSFWTFDALMHVALGWKYRGRRVRQGTIVYCALEGAQGFKNRIEAFRQAKMSEADGGDPPFYLMATPLSLVRDQKAFIVRYQQATWRSEARRGLHRHPQPQPRRL